MNIFYSDFLKNCVKKRLAERQQKQPKGEPCPNCGCVRHFHNVWCHWVRPDATIILNNHYKVRVCSGCGHRIYPAEMIKEYEELKRLKVLV